MKNIFLGAAAAAVLAIGANAGEVPIGEPIEKTVWK